MTSLPISRRQCHQILALGGLSSLSTLSWAASGSKKKAQSQDKAKHPVLVQVLLKGGMDSLSAIVPFNDPIYHQQRPRLAIQLKGQQLNDLQLDERFAFHPQLAPLMPLYKSGRLALVVAAGLPQVRRSHFDAQDIVESGGADQILEGGWMTRALSGQRIDPGDFDALSLGNVPARSLSGHDGLLTVPALNHFALPDGDTVRRRFAQALRKMYAPGRSPTPVSRAGSRALEVLDELEAIRSEYKGPHHGARYPKGGLGKHFGTLAELIRVKPKLRVATLTMGGWDSHRSQGGPKGKLAKSLGQLSACLAGFERDLGPDFSRVVVVVLTEFGRTVRENGTGGTDHGYGSAMMVLGSKVRGGQVHGSWPGLGPRDLHENRELRVTTDYRRVLEQARRKHLKLGAEDSPFDLSPSAPGEGLELFR